MEGGFSTLKAVCKYHAIRIHLNLWKLKPYFMYHQL